MDMTAVPTSEETNAHPLPPGTRARLERAFGTDLSAVRLHDDEQAEAFAERLGADAVTVGSDVYLRRGRRPGLGLLAHEVAHVLQQLSGRLPVPGDRDEPFRGRAGDRWEREADDAARHVLEGAPLPAALRGVPVGGGTAAVVARAGAIQCHDSFEHRALGDVSTPDLVRIAGPAGTPRTQVLDREIALQYLWYAEPESVTEESLRKVCPDIQTFRLAESGLLVTYGELNALPDYIATGPTADTIPKTVLLPILQYIRQESYIQLSKLVGRTETTPFAGSVFSPSQWVPGLINRLLESQALDVLSLPLGIDGTDHYSALLGRNACHFAPFSWYRWQGAYLSAKGLAEQAFAASDPNVRARLTHQAWIQVGYADHFLQDSFAAGHLVNKNLIMQWFVSWAAGKSLVPVMDWDEVQRMTADHQPGLAARQLYGSAYAGGSTDPQTAEDQATYQARRGTPGLVAGASGSVDAAYQDYFVFLSSLITQSASAAIHDHYNTNSSWVASVSHPRPYEVWGDDTFFNHTSGSEGVQETSVTTQLSRQSIREVLAGGRTSVTTQQLRDRFPTQVRGAGNQLLGLEAWNDTQRDFCGETIFPQLHDLIVRIAGPQIPNISQDEDLATRWSTSLPDTGYRATSVQLVGDRVFYATNGAVFELSSRLGAPLGRLVLSTSGGDVRLASDGKRLFAGVAGQAFGIKINGGFAIDWKADLEGAGSNTVDLITTPDALLAGSNGYVHRIEPNVGHVEKSLLLASRYWSGDYTMRLALWGSLLVAGTHGYVYAVRLTDFGLAWERSLDGGGYNPVSVLVRGTMVYAGTNGRAYQILAANGQLRQNLRVTDAVGVGDYTTTLAGDDQTLYVGVHGYVYGIRLDSWSKPAWEANLAGNRYSMVNLALNGDQLLAGSYGYLFRINPASGAVVRNVLLTAAVGIGEYETRVALTPDGRTAYVGIHGYGNRVSSLG